MAPVGWPYYLLRRGRSMETRGARGYEDGILYKVDDRPPLNLSVVLAIQHIMAAFGGIVAVPLIVGGR